MAMDFWEAQRLARKRTTVYVVIFVGMTLFIAIAGQLIFYRVTENVGFPFVALIFIALTFCVAGFQYSGFSSGGGAYVANSVGAYKVPENTDDPRAKQLLNIVDEIAIASSLPRPGVYIMPVHQINVFAAGTRPDNAVIAVTEGCLEQLNRDELQGVVAHEFGHIRNADMVLSLRLAAMVMGFFFVLYIALRILRIASFAGGGKSRDKKSGGNPVMLVALILFAAGAIAWLFGSILKATVSREREYLADASSVQFTRNPEGIVGALRKISGEDKKDMPKNGMAFSHMYFDNHASLDAVFATHPPLEKRIKILEGSIKR
jgi:heat shock protein HtpX